MRTTAAPPRRDRTSFVGRARELEALAALFAESVRLVTLVGPGGVGKTRLARRFAQIEDSPARPVVFCEVAEARTLSDVSAALAQALGASLADGDDAAIAVKQLGRAIAARGRTLIVFDDFEHVVACAPASVGLWLDLAPEADFLVTSREALRIDGEVRLACEPLPVDEAVELFEERARAVRAGAIDSAEREAVTVLVERLDRLPLAIELAATRASVLGPSELSARLADRFALLQSSRRDADARHGTLRTVIETSWSLLEPAEQQALAELAVFRGGFSLDAAAAVISADAPPRALALVEALYDKSLLRIVAATDRVRSLRYALYESVRDYATEQLAASGRSVDVELCHAEHYLEAAELWASQVHGPTAREALAALDVESENLLAVHERFAAARPALAARAALALDASLSLRGPFDRLIALLESARTCADQAADELLAARALIALGHVHRALRRMTEARASFDQARSIAARTGDRTVTAEALCGIGRTELQRSDLGEAARAYQEAIAELAGLAPSGAAARASYGLAVSRHLLGEHRSGPKHYDEALALCRAVGDRRTEGRVQQSLGALYAEAGRLGEASRALDEACRIADETGGLREEGVALASLGDIRYQLGDVPGAEDAWQRSIDRCRRAGFRLGEAFVLGSQARRRHEDGQLDEAERIYADVLAIAQQESFAVLAAVTRSQLALVGWERGDLGGADRTLRDALEELRRSGDRRYLAVIEAFAGALAGRLGRAGESRAALAAARASLEAMPQRNAEQLRALELLEGIAGGDRGGCAPAPPRHAEGTGSGRPGWEVAFAQRLVVTPQTPRGAEPTRSQPREAPALVVAGDARSFVLAGGREIDLSRRGAVRRILLALVEHHAARRGQNLSVFDLLEAGWPGEKVGTESGAKRVYWAIGSLRELGLKDVLLTRDDGYLLDPALTIRRA
jgi:predicted ATPase